MASLDIQSGPEPGRHFCLGPRSIMIGRDASCTIEIADELVSRRHLQIVYDPCRARHFAIDVGSSNGLFVNGVRVERGTLHVLADGDEIRIGRSLLRYAEPGSPLQQRWPLSSKMPDPFGRRGGDDEPDSAS